MIKTRSLTAAVFILAFAVSSHAAGLRQFSIIMPDKITTGMDVVIDIQGLNKDKKIISDPSKKVTVEIFNGTQTTITDLQLKNGTAAFTHSFNDPGASMITVMDATDHSIVEYKAFTVDAGAGK